MSYENDCSGVGDRNPRFVVIERDGAEVRMYACRDCNAMFDADTLRCGGYQQRTLLPTVPSHKPARIEEIEIRCVVENKPAAPEVAGS